LTHFLSRSSGNNLDWIEQESNRKEFLNTFLYFKGIKSKNEPQVRLINPKLQKALFLIISVLKVKFNLESKIKPRFLN